MLNIQEVTVTGDRPVIENKIDKVVYNVANDVTSQGGLAVDVLKKVPNVTVDLEGNVELQGNSNIRFLINGKPSSIFGSSVSDALSSIPASQIKSIEAITSPGAKYDAQGTGGIINIILHDNKMKGISGNINLSAGTRLENGSANLNLRHNNIGFNAFFGGRAFLKSEVTQFPEPCICRYNSYSRFPPCRRMGNLNRTGMASDRDSDLTGIFRKRIISPGHLDSINSETAIRD